MLGLAQGWGSQLGYRKPRLGIKGPSGACPSHVPSHMVSKAVMEGLPARPLKSDSSGVEGWCLLLSGLGKTLTHSECASPSGKMGIIVRIKGDDVNNVLSTLSGT